MPKKLVEPLRVSARTLDGWIRIYGVLRDGSPPQHPALSGHELARIRADIVHHHPRGKEWLKDVMKEIAQAVMQGALGAPVDSFSREAGPEDQEPRG